MRTISPGDLGERRGRCAFCWGQRFSPKVPHVERNTHVVKFPPGTITDGIEGAPIRAVVKRYVCARHAAEITAHQATLGPGVKAYRYRTIPGV